MSFVFADPKQLWLEIEPSTQAAAWQVSQRVLSPGGRSQVYLNQLCVRTVFDWARDQLDTAAVAFPPVDAAPTSWELVTGSCLTMNGIKLALLPTDRIGQDELWVPQEWMDIPGWAANYYLMVKVNPEERWIEGWGYATHKQIKKQGVYDAWERGYSLDGDKLSTDVGALWTTLEQCSVEVIQADTTVETVSEDTVSSEVSAAQAESLITRLSNPDVTFPRLSVPFAQWRALLANERLRHQLWTRRLATDSQPDEVSLSRVLQEVEGAIASGWQSIESVFGAEAQQLAFSRRGEQAEGRQAKDMEFTASNQSVRLVLLWQLKTDGNLAIQTKLFPSRNEPYLPPNIQLALISNEQETLQVIQSERNNNYIQIPEFSCPSGYTFCIEIQLDNQKITERFTT
ncbi:MAG: DUF1822 family protein [Cyanobacteria bacterium J06560_6]